MRFGKNELDKKKQNDKGERADYVAHVIGSTINIEINCNGKMYIVERNLEYANRLYGNKIKIGSQYHYTQTISININNYAYKGKDKIKYTHYLKDEDNEALTDKIIVIQIYVPNLIKKWYTSGVENLTEGERFLLALVIPDINIAFKLGKDNEIMEEYIHEAKEVSNDNEFRDFYSKEWKIMDQGYQDGEYDGALKKETEIVKKMLEENIDINLIMKVTGLSQEEIEAYQ